MPLHTWVSHVMKCNTIVKPTKQHTKKQFLYPHYVKDIDLDAHVWVFKVVIKSNGEIEDENIVNLLMFTL